MQIWLFITQAITHPLNPQIQKKKKRDQQKWSRGSGSLLETTTKSWLTHDCTLQADGILGPKENWGQNGGQKLKVVEKTCVQNAL